MKKVIIAGLLLIAQSAFGYEAYHSPSLGYSDTSVQVNNLGTPLTNVPTYSYQAVDITPAATATDVVCLIGSSSKTIKVDRIQITGDATGTSVIDFYVFKRAALNTGGTATQPAITKLDTLNAIPTGVINLYSANPSALGTGTVIAADHYALPAAATTGYPGTPWVEDFGIRNNQALVLRGAAESACVSLNGQTLPAGLSMYIRIEWTEE